MIPQLRGIEPRFSEGHDQVMWISKEEKQVNFSINQVWEDIRLRNSKVIWWHLIRFAKSIPKHCFTFWLAVRDRLLRQDRLKFWQINTSAAFSFCGGLG